MASISWKTGVAGSWTNGTLWSGGAAPTISDDVLIGIAGPYTVSVTAPASARTITMNASGATLSTSSTLTLGGLLSLTAGTVSMNNSVISGGTIAVNGGTFLVNSGTLSSVAYRGTLSLANANASLSVAGSIALSDVGGTGAGTVNLSGTSAIMAFVGTQTFSNATVNFGSTSQSSSAKLTEKDLPNAGATLTLGASLNIVSNGGYGFIQSVNTPATAALVNAGTIGFGSSGGLIEISANRFTNTGRLNVTNGGSLYLLTGPYGVPSGSVGGNSGTITLSSGLLAFGNTFTNTGSVVATGGTLTIAGTFSTTGVFTASNTKITLGGTISGSSLLALLNNGGNTVTYTALYDNTGLVLNIGSATTIGTLSLTSSLPIKNGIIADAGGGFLFNSGTLTNVVYQGTIDLSRNASNLNIATNLVSSKAGGGGPGAVKLTGTSSVLSFIGTQTFDNSTITIGSSVRTSIAKLQERDVAGTGATLTLGPSLKILSNSGSGLILSVNTLGNDALINKGVIQVATSGGLIEISANQFTNQGSLLLSNGGTLDILTGPYTPPPGEVGVNTGVIAASSGLLAFGGTFTNAGSITVSGGTLTLSGTFIDAGSLSVNNATVNLGGVFSGVSFLSILNNASDVVTLSGTYDNTGDTLDVGTGTALGTINLVNGLPIRGGTIVDHGGGLIYAGGTLDGVTYVGTMSLGSGAALDLLDGLVVQTGTSGGPGIVNLTGGFSSINFLNAQALDDLTITIGDASENTDSLYNNALGTVTLGPGVRLQQSTGFAQIYTFATATTVNQGTIAVGGDGIFQLLGNGGSFVNAGSIGVSGGASFGAYAFLGDSNFTNTGLLSATGGSSLTLEAGWSNTGTISVNGSTLQLGSDDTTAWASIGTINATNATLELQGAFTTAQLAQLHIAGGVTQILGALDNTGAVFTIGAATSFELDDGTITGGTISDTGGDLAFNAGTLDGVTYRGPLTVGAGGNVWVQNGITLLPASGSGKGAVNLTGGGSGLFVSDSETLDNAIITMGDASGETDYIQNYVYPGPGTLTLGSNLTIQQSVGDAAIYTAAGGTTINNGRIAITGGLFHVDYGTFRNAGTISVSGSTAAFDSNLSAFTNAGLITATGGGDIFLQAGWTNTGTISISGGGILQLGSDMTTAWGTIGTILTNGASLELFGNFTTAQLLSLGLTNDRADVDGVLVNTGATLNIGAGSGLATLGPAAGGVIRGGVVADAGGGFLAEGGTLDGVTYRGPLSVGANGLVNITHGLALKNAAGTGPGSLALTGGGSVLTVLDTETLDNATLTIGDASGATDILSNGGANGTTLTLGANLVLQQTTGQSQILNTGGSDLTVNRGQILVTGGTLDISGGSFSNLGTISVTGGAEVMFEPASLANYANSTLTGGVYVVGANSTLELARSSIVATLSADVTLSGANSVVQALNASNAQIGLDSSLRTISTAGALRLLSGRSLAVQGSLLDQGILQLGGGTLSTTSTATISGTLVGYGTVLGGIADSGLIEANGGLLVISNSTSGSGRLQVDSASTLELATTSALASSFGGTGGTLMLDRPTTYTGAISNFAAGDTIVLAGVTAGNVSLISNTLSVTLTNGTTLTYSVSGSFSGYAVRASNVGGNSRVTLASTDPSHVTGLLDNRNATLAVGTGTTRGILTLDGGSILGGTITDTGGGLLIGIGTLDGVAYQGPLTVGANGLLNIVDGLSVRSFSGGSAGTISVAGGGATLSVNDTETLDNATLVIGDASGRLDILANGGASGTTLTLGANLLLRQTTGQAQILNTGGSDVTINRGQISVSGGTLDISGGSFSNVGTISVTGGGEVAFDPATLGNFASGTLTGGTYVVGANATLELAQSNFIATLAADVTLTGTNSVIEALNASSVEIAVDATLRTIAAAGALRLLGGRSLSIQGSLIDQGLLQLGGGTLSTTSTATIGGSLVGYGSVVGGVTDNGVIEASGGLLTFANSVTGSGQFQIDAGATLELGTTTGLSSVFSGTGGTLLLDRPSTYTGTIGNFAIGDTIVLGGVTANAAAISGSTLNVSLTNGTTVSYALTGSFSGLAVQTSTVGGDTSVVLVSAAPTQITGLLDNTGNTLSVGNGTNLVLAGGTILGGVIADAGGGLVIGTGTLDGVTYRGTVAVGASGSLSIVDGLNARSVSGGSPGVITLAGGGSVLSVLDTETLDNATLVIGDASGATDILANAGAGAGTLTLGSNLLLQQTTGQAQILNTGSSDLTINRGQIAVSGGTLDISGGVFTNIGGISVTGGGEVMFEPAAFGNFASATLTGGVYVVGANSTLELARSSFVSTLSADVTLTGANSLFQALNSSNVQTTLDGTLRTITAVGALRLLGGRSLSLKAAVTDQGLVQLAGGTLTNTSTTTISGTLFGYGTVSGALTDTGLIEANGGRLNIVNIATGTGRMQVDAGATLELTTTNALASAFSGIGGTLQIDKPTTYTGTIGGFAVGNTIVLGGVTATSASISGGTLTVNLTTGKAVTYAVTGSFTGLAVQTASIGGNTNVTLATSGPNGAQAAALPTEGTARIGTSSLSLASAGFLDASGQLAGHVIAATAMTDRLTGTAGARDLFQGASAAFRSDVLVGVTGSGATSDLIDLTDLDFSKAVVRVTSGSGHATLSFTDGAHTASLTLGGNASASQFTLYNDGHGGTLIAHH